MKLRNLFSTDDYLSIWIGFFFLIVGTLIHLSQIDTIRQMQDAVITDSSLSDKNQTKELSKIRSMDLPLGDFVNKLVSIPSDWTTNPIDSVYNDKVGATKIMNLLGVFILFACVFGVGYKFKGGKFTEFVKGFVFLFGLSLLAFILSKQSEVSFLGINYAMWAICIGVIISNTVGVPSIIKPAVSSEYYIKTGLVILGAEILMNKILAIGIPGIFVAWVVTPIVLVTTYIFGQKVLKLKSKSLNMVICADMAVCGVSAAIATAAATNAKKIELTIAIAISMTFTLIMMVVMPLLIKAMGLPEVLAGAWIGGTLDSTGAVVAAGKFVGDKALDVAATIKMIQNILIGVVAFCVALYWVTNVEREKNSPRPKPIEIWTRMPKFLLGFIGASVIFSIFYSILDENTAVSVIDNGIIKGFTKNLKEWLFCLAFVSIGLTMNFKEFREHTQGRRHVILYCFGQCFNIIFTLGMAYLMFYIIFPEITASI